MWMGLAAPETRAQPAARPVAELPAAHGALEREVRSLRQRLEIVNTEVRALKRGPRSLGNDYRLRQKLADAESLGRRLTEAEARLRAELGSAPEGTPSLSPAPNAAATDGPAELAAKADILLDQAQKLSAQADRLEHRVDRERQRSTLRARARHLQQDPFVGLESSKRNIAFSRSTETTRPPTPREPQFSEDPAAGPVTAEGGAPASAPLPPAPSGSAESDDAGTSGRGSSDFGAPAGGEGGVSTSVAIAFRALLDAGTLAQVERLESSGDPRARAKALQAVVEALRERARRLQAEAKALRAAP